jgi:acyl-CoA synthetase (AMP-forming)/AMP-acid ligase II
VQEAAVIAVPHAKWDERPLLIVVPHPSGPPPSPEDVLAFMQAGGPAESARALTQP